MEYFCGDKKEEYTKYLGKEKPWCSQYYIDPDGTYKNSASPFYKKLVGFLILMEKKFNDNWEYSFHHKYTKNNENPNGIWVSDSNNPKPILFLRSDQFGFSAPREENRAWNSKYPYASFLNLGGEKEFAAKCIWDMRTLGGSFLWPLIDETSKDKKCWRSKYNMNRGVRSYIEDSVDLTLYEIRSFYNLIEKYKNENNKMISKRLTAEGYILLQDNDNEKICEWLRHFENFKAYVEYFGFRPFVDDEYQVIDITKSTLPYDEKGKDGFTCGYSILSEETVEGYRMSKRIETIEDKEKIKQILINVRNMTLRRTIYMETILLYNQEVNKHLKI